jgi:hypothetical protein
LHQDSCAWLKQYGSNLAGTQVLYATQKHYENNPQFIDLLITWSGAAKTLVVIDEAGFLMNLPRVTIKRSDLERFSAVLRNLAHARHNKLLKKWSDFVYVLLMTTTKDLQTPGAWVLYELESSLVNLIQAAGVQAYPDDFCYLGNVLMQLCKSYPYSRECLPNGDISFAQMLNIPADFIVYSGTTELELLQYRLDQECFDLYKDLQFRHKHTCWYNVATTLAADRHFKRNSPQILDFYAELITKRIRQGQRVLLVAKKRFKTLCEEQLNNRFHANNSGILAKVDFNDCDLANHYVVPIIHFGVIGINLFEDFDCCFCLTSYFVDEKVVNQTIQSIYSSNMQIPLEITMNQEGVRRRIMQPTFAKDRFFNVSTLAQHALNYNEMGVVIQAVGRVRPFTKPREIITLQCSELLHSGGGYTQEFTCFDEARQFFKIQSKRDSNKLKLQTLILDLKREGCTQKIVADHLGIDVRTVKRYWNLKN